MISDSLPNASIAMVSSNHKDFAKKKRVNRSAKLKQCKLDARREQWLSQGLVKTKGVCKVDVNGGGEEARRGPLMSLDNVRGRSVEKLEIKPRDEEIYGDGTDSEFSPSNSPTSHISSLLGSSNGSGVNFTGSSRSVSSRSSSSGSNGGFTETMSEEEGEEDDSCLEDDWEAVADALAANDDKKLLDCKPESEDKHESIAQSASSQLENIASSETGGGAGVGLASVNRRAWRPDDAFRPQSLPNLSKQNSFPLNSERHFGSVWGCKNVGVVPTSCPICCEDLDLTDSTFLPCSCGFRLCLFCHKRILEQDARCPGCRKHYSSDPVEAEGGSLAMRLARSCSMITRS